MSLSEEAADLRDGAVPTQHRGIVVLLAFAVLGGVLTGFVGGAFRWTLTEAERLRGTLVEWAQQWPVLGVLIPVVVAAVCVALSRAIVRAVPEAAGSGVQRVEAAMRGQVPLERLRVLPAKFVGGVLAIGSGLALGREGPTVQMGASIGGALGGRLKREGDDRTIEAGLSGAGLAVAFSAPLGGSVFVFEELTKRVTVRLVGVTLLAAACAVVVSERIVGRGTDFLLSAQRTPEVLDLFLFGLLGGTVGLMAAAYNRSVVFFLDLAERLRRIPPEVYAAVVGGGVGAVAFYFPVAVGGGDPISQATLDNTSAGIGVLLALLAFRWLLGTVSYSLGTPGGLFAPLLAVGALTGALFATVGNTVLDLSVPGFAFVGMAAFFAGVVRAPLTGIVVTAEMAGSVDLLIPCMIAAVAAVAGAVVVKSEPIYDTLRDRLNQAPPQRRRWH